MKQMNTPSNEPSPTQNSASGQEVALPSFEFAFNGRHVRSILKDGEAWFVAADVCAILEQPNITQVLARLDDDEKTLHIVETRAGLRQTNLVDESGLYALILTSRKPQAKAFRRWVTRDVLPSIRRTGRYQVKPDVEDAGEKIPHSPQVIPIDGPQEMLPGTLPAPWCTEPMLFARRRQSVVEAMHHSLVDYLVWVGVSDKHLEAAVRYYEPLLVDRLVSESVGFKAIRNPLNGVWVFRRIELDHWWEYEGLNILRVCSGQKLWFSNFK